MKLYQKIFGKPFKATKTGVFIAHFFEKMPAIIKGVQAFKIAIERKEVDANLERFIPGEKSKRVLEFVRKLLPEIIRGLGLLKRADPYMADTDVVCAAIQRMIDMPETGRGQWYIKMARAACYAWRNGKGTDDAIDREVKTEYEKMKADGELALDTAQTA